jgi:AcrR family transcriptional regulator
MPKVIPGYRDEARRKIIAAGLEVMSRKGYYNTTLEDIANHIGVSKTTLYLYFSNKEDLLIEVINTIHRDIYHQAMNFFTTMPVLDAYTALLDLFLERSLEQIGLFHDIQAISARDPGIRKISEDYMNESIENAMKGIICLQQKGIARRDRDPRSMAIGLISLINGMSNLVLRGFTPAEIRKWFSEMAAIMLGIPE